MFSDLKPGEKLHYGHLKKLPYMTRCLFETLRKWPGRMILLSVKVDGNSCWTRITIFRLVVPNGTFRELQFDETIVGPNDTQVKLPKGTYVQITNWMRHRSPKLWKDPEVFNPDREFEADEIWNGAAFSAYNPASKRFSPFVSANQRSMLVQLCWHLIYWIWLSIQDFCTSWLYGKKFRTNGNACYFSPLVS